MSKIEQEEQGQWNNWVASLTDGCQNSCPGCYRILKNDLLNQDIRASDLSLDNFRNILYIFKDQAPDKPTVDFVGGEPTLNPYFLDMMTLALESDINPWVYTNLRTFGTNPPLVKEIKKLADQYPGKLTIVGKLNVPDVKNYYQRKLQAELIGSDDNGVEEMWNGLNILLQAGLPAGSVGIENLIRQKNIDFAADVYELGIKMGFFADMELPTCPVNVNKESYSEWLKQKPTRNQVIELIKQINVINKKYGIALFTPRPPHLTGRNYEGVGTGCVTFKQGALLTESDGRLALCTSGLPLTDVNGKQLNILTDDIKSVLSNPAVLKRRASINQNNIQGTCGDCSAWNNCMAGCAALRESLLGDVNQSYPLCIYGDWLTDVELTKIAFQNIKE